MIATSVLDQLAARAAHEDVQQVLVGAIVQVEDSVLFLRRRYRHGLGGAALDLPAGSVRRQESLSQAVIRVMSEKTGLKVTDVHDYVGSFDYRSSDGSRCRQINFAVWVAAPEPVRLSEHHGYRWIPLYDELPVTGSVREVIRKYRNIHYV
jgi:8-oxo-dGTP diphosphatase